jgi:hypothetical protein
MIFNIKNEELQALNESEIQSFPKYTSQLINWANQNAQGTRPRVVGQLSDLFPKYIAQAERITITDWKEWYISRYPDAINEATEKIYSQVEKLKEAIRLVNHDMVKRWVEDLVITKTFNGLFFQKAILAKLAEIKGQPFRLARPEEESLGIDGYVGDNAYSIKPDSYKTMGRLPEVIDVTLIYYTKKKSGLTIEVQD